MTVQEAYNRGLDVAENDAHEKFSKALVGVDAGPFANPKMEELRQQLLSIITSPIQNQDESFVIKFFKNEEIDETRLSSTDEKILDFLKYCKRSIPKRSVSRHSVLMREYIKAIEVDIAKNNDKL